MARNKQAKFFQAELIEAKPVGDSDEIKVAKAKYRKALFEGHNPAIPWGTVLSDEQRKEVENE